MLRSDHHVLQAGPAAVGLGGRRAQRGDPGERQQTHEECLLIDPEHDTTAAAAALNGRVRASVVTLGVVSTRTSSIAKL